MTTLLTALVGVQLLRAAVFALEDINTQWKVAIVTFALFITAGCLLCTGVKTTVISLPTYLSSMH
jgi:hypothetical protein